MDAIPAQRRSSFKELPCFGHALVEGRVGLQPLGFAVAGGLLGIDEVLLNGAQARATKEENQRRGEEPELVPEPELRLEPMLSSGVEGIVGGIKVEVVE